MSTTETICWFIVACLLVVFVSLIRVLISLHRLRKQIRQTKTESETLLRAVQDLRRR